MHAETLANDILQAPGRLGRIGAEKNARSNRSICCSPSIIYRPISRSVSSCSHSGRILPASQAAVTAATAVGTAVTTDDVTNAAVTIVAVTAAAATSACTAVTTDDVTIDAVTNVAVTAAASVKAVNVTTDVSRCYCGCCYY